ILPIEAEVASPAVGWSRLALDVIRGSSDQEVQKINARFVSGEDEISVHHVRELFDQFVVVKIAAELDSVRPDNLTEVIQGLERVFNQVIGTAGHTDDQPRTDEVDFRDAFDRRINRNDAKSPGVNPKELSDFPVPPLGLFRR